MLVPSLDPRGRVMMKSQKLIQGKRKSKKTSSVNGSNNASNENIIVCFLSNQSHYCNQIISLKGGKKILVFFRSYCDLYEELDTNRTYHSPFQHSWSLQFTRESVLAVQTIEYFHD